MFKYLEKLLGKPIRYYENLMASKKEHTEITALEIDTIVNALKPHVLKAYALEKETMSFDSYPLADIYPIPQNKKEIAFLYTGTYLFENVAISLYIDLTKGFNDKKKYDYVVHKKENLPDTLKQELSNIEKIEQESLPIWEEVIHRFPDIHKAITTMEPNHPWTLYKKVKETFKPTTAPVLMGGYPQWRVNDVDFRKLKNLEFLMEYRVNEKEYSIYFFKDLTTQELLIMEQKA
ncbi:hypothetical protein LY01_02236 [Nonlabens xylanidelens]|uniref:Uncharacterized protein n=1 Tax=Nonlabens xylanidelens TaxID=191564 RepID=A0A2S6IIG1_9FLAO|nr:hypothetical protein [Nonlabens xylanidelens]PPK94014.1 hypothetical protein LY01_02236 [Nonlabens xylanidelens]PQJ22169.1 hypothetical protein BST94_00900 [Nonlabens xylanidelens]